jgi:hypothetical protein
MKRFYGQPDSCGFCIRKNSAIPSWICLVNLPAIVKDQHTNQDDKISPSSNASSIACDYPLLLLPSLRILLQEKTSSAERYCFETMIT